MKTLTIDTGLGNAVLTFSEIDQRWNLFSGNLDELANMADLAGYDYQATGLFLGDWVARNKELFIKEEKEVTPDELWEEVDEEIEFVVMDNSSNSESCNYLNYAGESCEIDNAETFKSQIEAQEFADYHDAEQNWAVVSEK